MAGTSRWVEARKSPRSISPGWAGRSFWMMSCRRPRYSSTSPATLTKSSTANVSARAGAPSQTRPSTWPVRSASTSDRNSPLLRSRKGSSCFWRTRKKPVTRSPGRRSETKTPLSEAVFAMAGSHSLFMCGIPIYHPQGAQGVPPAGPALGLVQLHRHGAGVLVLQRPAAVAITFGLDQLKRLGQPFVRRGASAAQVFEPAQYVVVPPARKGEACPGGVDDLTGRAPPQQAALQQVFLTAQAGLPDLGAVPASQLIFEQGFQHADGGVERRACRAVGGLTVPAAVGQLLAQQAPDNTLDVLAKVGAAGGHLPIDARLHLTREEGRAIKFPAPPYAVQVPASPAHVVADQAHRTPGLVTGRIEAQFAHQREDVHGGVPAAVPRRAGPGPVGPLQGQQPSAHPLGGHPCPLSGDLLRGRTGQVAHRLPADGRVRIKQPLDRGPICYWWL